MELASARKAGFWVRVVAYIIDAIIVGVVMGVISGVLSAAMGADGAAGLVSLISIIISVGYYVYFWTTSGQTVGQKVMSLRVIRTDGSPLTVTNAILRLVGLWISTVALFIGLIWVAFDANKQGWHDKIAGTYVVHTK